MDNTALELPTSSPEAGVQEARITGNDLPDDVWRLIANYLRGPSRLSIYYISVNRTFFNLALSAKYGEIRWYRPDKSFVQILKRLQEPIIAGYVQKLFIRAWFIDFLFKREELFHSTSAMNNCKPATGMSALARLAQYLFLSKTKLPTKVGHEFQKSWEAGKLIPETSSKELVKMLVQAVSGMTSVTEFNFDWRDLPLNKHTAIFLTSTRTAFDASLRKLMLRAQIPKLKELLAITNFDNIDELDLHFDYRPQGPDHVSAGAKDVEKKDPDVDDLHNTVVPFIAHRRAQLHTLAISSSANVDLSPFFNALPPLYTLRRFSVCLSFDKHALSDPAGLLRVLQNGKSTLLYVSFEAEWPSSASSGNDGQPFTREAALQQKRASWASLNTQLLRLPDCLSGLESLRIPFVSVAETLPIIHRSCDTLRRLSVNDHFLSSEEVGALAGVFAHRPFELKYLHIEVAHLDIALVQLLASRFPGLDSLVIVFKSFAYFMSHIPDQCTPIQDWYLSYFKVYEERYRKAADNDHGHFEGSGVHSGVEATVERTIASWVPGLGEHKGHPPPF